MSKRPAAEAAAAGSGKRSAPAFLADDDDYYGEDEDVFLDEALAAGTAAQAQDVAGVRASWRRPPPPCLDPATSALEFQGLEVDYVVAAAHPDWMPLAPRQARCWDDPRGFR